MTMSVRSWAVRAASTYSRRSALTAIIDKILRLFQTLSSPRDTADGNTFIFNAKLADARDFTGTYGSREGRTGSIPVPGTI